MESKHQARAGLSRRLWIQGALASSLGIQFPAHAQASGPYKALVCVFLYGGNDGLNCLVPTDERYAKYAAVRGGLAIGQGQLVGLDGVPFGLHPALSPLQPMWQAGQMAAVLNVGTLVRPLAGREDYLAQKAALSAALPPNLFSHADQQTLWQAADGQAVSRSGWGARAASILLKDASVYTVARNAHFGTSESGPCIALPVPGAEFRIGGIQGISPDAVYGVKRRDAYLRMLDKTDYPTELERAYTRLQKQAMQVSDTLVDTVRLRPVDLPADDPIGKLFNNLAINGGTRFSNSFAMQLFQIAKLIRQGSQTGAGPQIYFVGAGDFDHHAGQLDHHGPLLSDLASALAAFHGAMQAMGLGNAVTSFTESDFGRTFKPNASGGTDHAWGNIQFVMGGAVKGKATYGSYPELTLGGPDDVGEKTWEQQGRWIPKISVEQYAATLLGWLGASEGQLNQILPRLPAFAPARLGFI